MNTYKKLLKYTPERMGYAYLSMIFSVGSTILTVLPYWYLWKFLNELIVEQSFEGSYYYARLIVGLMLLNALVYFVSLWCSHLLAFRLETNLRKKGIDRLMKASFSFFDVNPSGKVRKIIDDNAAETHMVVAHLIPDTIAAVLTPLLAILLIFFVDAALGGLFVLVTLAGLFHIKGMIGNKEFMGKYMESLEKMNAEAVEYVRGMQVLKIFRTTVYSFKSFYEAIVGYSNYALGYALSCRSPYVMFQALFNTFILFILPFSFLLARGGEEPEVVLTKIIFYACFAGIMFTCLMRVMYVGMYHFQANQVVDKLENLFEEMGRENIDHGEVCEFEGFDIEFRNVFFKYGEEDVLKDLSFKLEQNKTYALVGSSGSGKSTIAKLISGFYKIHEGRILIGGRDIQDYSESALMSRIAFVFQNAKLFKKTIYENVSMGKEDATYEEVMSALKKARCEDILDKFPERENTLIGSKGVHLSGGEIQRIAIARAILKDAAIIILDEASAAADPENEYEIQQAFSNLMEKKTVIMIAHRLSSIRKVDEVLLIDGGLVVERGPHEELMKKDGKYKMLQELFSKANDWRVYD
ncbi:MAG: ABC transporter ATP-binding protein [Filifactor alocis]|nr:ABC transporter ATP-binding protein [Filifactor alocis]